MNNETRTIRVSDLETAVGIDRVTFVSFVTHEWITPHSADFLDEEDIARIRLILDLRNQFNANDDAIPVILHLTDQLYALRNQIQSQWKREHSK